MDSFRKSSCTEEELEELDNWYENLNSDGRQIDDLIAKSGGQEQLAEQLYENFSKKVLIHRKSKSKLRWWSVAAAIVLFASGLIFYKIRQNTDLNNALALNAQILPGTNKAILTLADGTHINLDNAAEGELYNKNGLSILKTDSGSLTYITSSASSQADLKMLFNSIYVPKGGQYKVTLPDGTNVWINSASTLKFPVTSNGIDRSVSLSGEGYFEVVHNKHLPFKVLTAGQEVQVLGTHFNIKGYQEENFVSTTLVEGSVRIGKLPAGASKLLVPGQQARTNKRTTDIDITSVNVKQAMAWKNGYFIFDDQDIQSIMKAISRWYDIDVQYVGGISKDRFGGTFSRHSNLSEILVNLQELGDVKFLVQGRKVIVSKVEK